MVAEVQKTFRCPGCLGRDVFVFFENHHAPVFCNVLWEDRQAAIASPRAAIRLGFCPRCQLIYNVDFDASLLDYSKQYENSLHYSNHFQKYAEDLACRLVKRHHLYNKDVIEIGCGQGDFLALLASAGENRGVGFDPSFDLTRASTTTQRLVKVVPEFYSVDHTEYPADIICCRQVLEHVISPLKFLKSIRKLIGERYETIAFFEVPNAMYTLRDKGIWDIIYEHCSYFTPQSLTNLFFRAGFEVMEVGEQYGGQFITLEARPARVKRKTPSNIKWITGEPANLIDEFRRIYHEKTSQWNLLLANLKKQYHRIAIWGAGSKGITFLNTLNISHKTVPYVVDVNPFKHGRYLTGMGQKIVPPIFLQQYIPQALILMNPIYQEEIRETMRKLDLNAEILLA
ncbi:MAG: methyltransferase domain-containing protein [Phycisphaerae bacterium]|jgi:2-polyprenyl-3-methyl-5-hydroxy-6-metoxy-1,4-benzoquinol methylase|nr:methyltransferase domain-containing protein [Phycisphaerae bacterium]